MNKNALQIQHVSKSFGGIQALSDVSFTVTKGTVHALCGENGAGKSTLMKILSGEIKKYDGKILLDDTVIQWNSPHDALYGGIATIAQELNPLLDMTIAENIFLGREPATMGFLNRKLMYAKAKKALSYFDLDFDVSKKLRELSIAQIQLIEIVKAISYNSEVIIMDEPTSAIGEQETQRLFAIIRKLKQENRTIIYISHRMNEIYTIADDVTVLRDGQHIISTHLADLSSDELVYNMIGQKISSSYFVPPKPLQKKSPLLDVVTISKKQRFTHTSFTLHKKEILGIFGLMGSGRSTLLKMLFGIEKFDEGAVLLEGKEIDCSNPAKAVSSGLGFVVEDRKEMGLIIDHPIRSNLTLSSLPSLSFGGFIKRFEERQKVTATMNAFNIKAESQAQATNSLSGGNQQKVVIGKWVLTSPSVLLLDEPTRGIDIGAKHEIYQFMNKYIEDERGIIMVSSELPEILAMSHRVLLCKKGCIIAERERADFDQEEFMRLIS